ncbi:MAG: hypothetical protein IT285_08000 [Bdellovibrionales bacterium]|nr:hypothetical protein [Bdellovibrionales bacterium]
MIRALQGYIQRPWYPPLLGLLAAADHFVVVVPTDGLLITAVLAAPRRWPAFFAWLTLGSVLGALLLAATIQIYGTPFLEWLLPGIHADPFWKLSTRWIDEFGLWALLAVAALPIFQHPAIAIAALAEIPLSKIALFIFVGRVLKYGALSGLALRAPEVLMRFKGLRKEVRETGACEP